MTARLLRPTAALGAWVLTCAGALLLAGCATNPDSGSAGALAGAEVDRRVEGALVFEDVPEVAPALLERMRRYRSVRSASLQDWLPDGTALVATRFGETTQLHHVTEPGAARRQLTFFAEPVAGAVASPNPSRPGFVYRRDVGGGEFYQLFFHDLATGDETRITDGVSRNSSAVFDRDGGRIAWASTARNGVDTDVWVALADPVAGEARAVTMESGSWYPLEFSRDGTRLLVTRYVSRSDARPHVLDLARGTLTPVLPAGVTARVDGAAFGADDRSVLYTSDLGGEFVRLYRAAEAGATPASVTGDVAHDVERFALSDDGRLLAWAMNEETVSRLYLRDLERGSFVALPEIPEGVLYGLAFSDDGQRLGFTLNASTSPGDVYSIDLAERRLERWTESEVGGLDTAGFVTPEHFRYETFDAAPQGGARTIPAYVYRPTTPGPHPVVINIHGGPESQARPYFSSTYQYWVKELGAAVIRPNVRGSTGYGRSFHRLDDGVGREDSVRDIGALLDWIETQPDLDASRVIVTGGSYGGYMVLASLTLYPERIRAAVETVGISNFVTFLENTQDYRRDLRRAEYGDERDPAMRAHLEAISPLGRVERIDAPLLVLQGANDPRVPASESRQVVDAVRGNGREVWYLLAGDEGHGFRKRGNQDVAAAVTALFLERWLAED